MTYVFQIILMNIKKLQNVKKNNHMEINRHTTHTEEKKPIYLDFCRSPEYKKR